MKSRYAIIVGDKTYHRTAGSHLSAADKILKVLCSQWNATAFRVSGQPRHDGEFQGFVDKGQPCTERFFVKEVQVL